MVLAAQPVGDRQVGDRQVGDLRTEEAEGQGEARRER